MGTGVPLLNEYKQEFVAKRFPQTVLGGLKLRVGYNAPVYVYVSQLMVFIVPFLLGGGFTLLVELEAMGKYTAVYVYGGLMAAYVLLIQLISHIVQASHPTDLPMMKKKKSLLSEEDEVDFISCCDPDTVKFIIPPKKYKVNILVHALLAGPMCGLGLLYLLPSTMDSLYGNTGGTVVLFILGWFALLVAQYPLTTVALPETATYRTTDILELGAVSRAFYVYVLIMFDLIHRFHDSNFLLTNQVLHVFFVCLPVFWTLGVLSPVDAFLLYLLEQAHVFLFGGSYMASDLRLITFCVLSTGVYLGAFYISSCLGTVLISSLAGYLLSTDLGGLGSQLWALLNRNRVSAVRDWAPVRNGSPVKKFLWKWGVLEIVYHTVMLAVVGVVAGLMNSKSQTISSSSWKIVGYCIIGVCVFEKVVRDLQGVFICFGLWRNPLFPPSLSSGTFKGRKKMLLTLGIIRRIVVNWAGPLLMLGYLCLVIIANGEDTKSVSATRHLDHATSVWYIFGVVRVYRAIWQHTVHSLLELSISHLVLVTMTTNTTVLQWGIPILAMLVSLCRDRLYNFSDKLYFYLTLLISSWTDKKQRRSSTVPIIIVSVILFPLVLGIIAVASALAIPLLPLFTLPMVLFSFPRPLRSWPEEVGASANSCPDTNFYKQLAPELSRALSSGFANGSLGEPSPGNHYLVRYQDRLVWIVVLERGATYCVLNIKGLELQETSCHTVEAARIDEIFENALELREGCSRMMGKINEYPLHTLTPADASFVETYSDARNVLTGIIDTPNATEDTMKAFLKSLVWIVLKYVKENHKIKANKLKGESVVTEKQIVVKTEKHELKELSGNNNVSNSLQSTKKAPLEPLDLGFEDKPESPPPPPYQATVAKQKKMASSWGSLASFTDSIFSEDEGAGKKKSPKTPANGNKHVGAKRTKSPDIEDLFDEFNIGMPAFDVTKPNPQVQNKFGSKSYGNSIYRPQTNLAGSPDFKSPFSSQLSIPHEWRELPLDTSQISRHVSKFPVDWYKYVLSCVDLTCENVLKDQVLKDVVNDDTLRNCYTQLIMACYSIFESQGYSGASFLYKSYMGEVSVNAMWDWLGEHTDLQALVKKAFRYGFKLMIDQMLLGEFSTDADWREALEEYDTGWYIGVEREHDWTTAILNQTPNMFSMGHNTQQSTYNSRTLTLQSMPVSIGHLNPEAVRGQWANLGLELLYMTNDDEERYSIQAHPVLLRNLTVQAADPPLGYPIYSSQPISVPLA
ncbi:pecanex-like protein 4 isoform X3 [Dreissena polymorpha]|uniref:pecanex-like protein 4 isoform X3 n=1 Tax=Dreissena polymorpha TaxID=45954 RepID=UPI002264572D|nr:pecanex-like protein 4 isoform X3 [Dreissena polymorpha]